MTTQLIKFKRGLKSALPLHANLGEPLFASNTAELYIGTGASTDPVLVTGEDRYVTVGAAGDADYLNSSYFEQDNTNHIRIKQNTLLTNVDVDMVDGVHVDDGEISTDYLWTASKAKGYIDTLVNGLDWQNSIIKTLNIPAITPPTGGRYIVGTVPTGVFVGHANQIAIWGGSNYTYISPNVGFAAWDEFEDVQKFYDGSTWSSLSSTTSHNATSGLQGGTTNQYYHLTQTQYDDLTDGGTTTLHKHNTDNLTEGVTNLFYTDSAAITAVQGAINDTDSINFSAPLATITFDAKYQTTDSITLADTASGIKADLKKQNTDSVTLAVDSQGLKATLNTQDTDSVVISIPDANGLMMQIAVDAASIVIDEITGFIYVDAVDGGAF